MGKPGRNRKHPRPKREPNIVTKECPAHCGNGVTVRVSRGDEKKVCWRCRGWRSRKHREDNKV